MPSQSWRRLGGVRRWSVLVKFEPRDLWVGVFWDRRHPGGYEQDVLDIYVCVLPALPILFKRIVTVYG